MWPILSVYVDVVFTNWQVYSYCNLDVGAYTYSAGWLNGCGWDYLLRQLYEALNNFTPLFCAETDIKEAKRSLIHQLFLISAHDSLVVIVFSSYWDSLVLINLLITDNWQLYCLSLMVFYMVHWSILKPFLLLSCAGEPLQPTL